MLLTSLDFLTNCLGKESGDDAFSHMINEKSLPNLQPQAFALFHHYRLDYGVHNRRKTTIGVIQWEKPELE